MSTGGRICCVCHKPLGDEAEMLGGRIYCPDHYARVTQERKGVWSSGGVEIAGVIIFGTVVALLAWWLKPTLSGVPLM